MTKPLSLDLRHRIIRAVEEEGMSRRGAAARFGVAPSTAIELVRQWRRPAAARRARKAATGARPGSRHIQRRSSLWWRPRRTSRWARSPSISSRRTASGSCRAWSGGSSIAAPSRSKKTAHASEQDRPDVAAQRAAWQALQPEIDIDRLVFIDETGASTKMARRYGRSPHGKRCVARIPHGHWQTTTFVGALRATGMTAPMVLDGAMDGPAFETYVKEVLAPTLRPGDIVVMDNLPAHKRAESQPRSRRQAPGSCTCRPIRPTSIRSRWPSPSSRPPCARPLPDQSKPW